jgi:hypothetical protein
VAQLAAGLAFPLGGINVEAIPLTTLDLQGDVSEDALLLVGSVSDALLLVGSISDAEDDQ